MNAPKFHVHVLAGCAPRPLASYLKALGVLRIVSEQADPLARGRWREDRFELITALDEDALLAFFLRTWSPSPAVSPWNKGSGLLGADPKGVDPVAASTAPRFAALRDGIQAARGLTAEMQAAVAAEKLVKDEKTRIKDKAGKDRLAADPLYKARLAAAAKACKRLKDELQPECQRRWRGPAQRWLRAAVVLDSSGKASFPALLGTGGNDGKLDFTNNALQRLGDLFDLSSPTGSPKASAEAALRGALLGRAGRVLIPGGIGQFSPAASGGANATAGALADSALNPWDLPLLLEGALLFTAGTSRRLGSEGAERTVAPFSARSVSAGYGSAAISDEGARGEQWMPLWSRPWTAGELSALLAEGRCQNGTHRADTSLDVARAVARLGVARGVDGFERYGFIERNGKSNYAVPLGRWPVRAEPLVRLLDDLEAQGWWERTRRAARDDKAPASLGRLERQLEEAVMAALATDSGPGRWQRVLLCLGELEQQLVLSGAYTVAKRLRPLPGLSPSWVRAADDGSPELRLALALAGAGASHTAVGRPLNALRAHWLPLERHGGFAVRERGLAVGPDQVVSGRDPEIDLISIVQRRIISAGATAQRTLPIAARPGVAASLSDLPVLVDGSVDLSRTFTLARALSALAWDAFDAARHGPSTPGAPPTLDPIWATIRLCHLPVPLRDGRTIPVDPMIVRHLSTGDAARAYALASRHLQARGIQSPLRAVAVAHDRARRLAASLAFPIHPADAARLVQFLDPSGESATQESHHVL